MIKNMNEKSDIYYPTCRFCGSTELPSGEYDSQEQADEAATIRCECCNAREYQTALKAKKNARKTSQIFEEGSMTSPIIANPAAQSYLMNCIALCLTPVWQSWMTLCRTLRSNF